MAKGTVVSLAVDQTSLAVLIAINSTTVAPCSYGRVQTGGTNHNVFITFFSAGKLHQLLRTADVPDDGLWTGHRGWVRWRPAIATIHNQALNVVVSQNRWLLVYHCGGFFTVATHHLLSFVNSCNIPYDKRYEQLTNQLITHDWAA